jgi:hypothetical protein
MMFSGVYGLVFHRHGCPGVASAHAQSSTMMFLDAFADRRFFHADHSSAGWWFSLGASGFEIACLE